jgi:hypothetical protein
MKEGMEESEGRDVYLVYIEGYIYLVKTAKNIF